MPDRLAAGHKLHTLFEIDGRPDFVVGAEAPHLCLGGSGGRHPLQREFGDAGEHDTVLAVDIPEAAHMCFQGFNNKY